MDSTPRIQIKNGEKCYVFPRLFPAYVLIFVMRIMKRISLNSSKRRNWSERWTLFPSQIMWKHWAKNTRYVTAFTSRRYWCRILHRSFEYLLQRHSKVFASAKTRHRDVESALLHAKCHYVTYIVQPSVWSEKAICENGGKSLFHIFHFKYFFTRQTLFNNA